MRRGLALATMVVAAGLAAGCGGDGDSSEATAATEWAGSFCTAFTTWTSELQRTGQTLSLSQSAETVQSAADDVKSATDELLDALTALGPPQTESGQDVLEAVDELTLTLTEQISAIESTVESLSVPTGVSTTVPAISEAFSTMRTAAASALQTIQQAAAQSELEEAFAQSESCNELTDTTG